MHTPISINLYQLFTTYSASFYLDFGVYISDCIVHHFKHSIYVITIQRIIDKIQWLFFQCKWFLVISIKYTISIYTHWIIYIPSCVHKLDQGNMFTDILNNVKSPIYLPLIDLITNTMLVFISYLDKHNCVGKYYYIRITVWFTYRLFFNTSWIRHCSNNLSMVKRKKYIKY